MRLTIAALIVLTGPALVGAGEEALTESTWRGVLEHVLPEKAEVAWRDVGWHPTLWDAVIEAHAEKKPILLWAMNGHALACT